MDAFRPEDPTGGPRPGPPPYPGGSEDPAPRDEAPRSRLAIAALPAALVPVLGIVVGLVAVRRTGPGRRRGRNLAIIGLTACVLWTGLIGLIVAIDGSGVLRNDLDRDAAGRIAEAGELDVHRLRTGDCLQDPRTDDDEIDTVDAVPCSQPHDAQVVRTVRVRDEDFPGDAAIRQEASRCIPPVRGAARRLRGRPDLPPIAQDFSILPSEHLWDLNDERDIACLLILRRKFTGSLP